MKHKLSVSVSLMSFGAKTAINCSSSPTDLVQLHTICFISNHLKNGTVELTNIEPVELLGLQTLQQFFQGKYYYLNEEIF